MKSEEALQAIARFCEHQRLNPQWSLSFRYVTTAELGVERDWDGSGSAIATWEAIRLHKYGEAEEAAAVGLIAAFLRCCSQPEKVSKSSWDRLRSVVEAENSGPLLNIIRRLEWSTGHGDYLKVRADIKEALAALGQLAIHRGNRAALRAPLHLRFPPTLPVWKEDAHGGRPDHGVERAVGALNRRLSPFAISKLSLRRSSGVLPRLSASWKIRVGELKASRTKLPP